MRTASSIAALLTTAVGIAGCSAFAPFPAAPQLAAAGVTDRGPRVAVCYDFAISSAAEVQKAAQDQCAADTSAERVATDWKLDLCPVLLPAHATFVCRPAK